MDSGGFTMEFTLSSGEDIADSISWFSRSGTRNILVVQASGTVSGVKLRNVSGVSTHLGFYDIVSLNTYGTELTISMVDNEGTTITGNVVGQLLAASPVRLTLTTVRAGVVPAATHAVAAPGQSSSTGHRPFYQFFPDGTEPESIVSGGEADGTEPESTVSGGGAEIPFYQFDI